MAKSLIKVQFVCPETGEVFSTAAAAEKSAKKAQNKAAKKAIQKAKNDAIRNSFRLELENIHDFSRLLNEKIKKHIGVELNVKLTDIRFGQQSCGHSAPIGQHTNWCARDKNLPTEFLGWRATISGDYVKKDRKNVTCGTITGDFSFSDYRTPFGGFAGVNTGTGGGGDNSWGYDCTIFLSDFSKLEKTYAEYLKVMESHSKYNTELADANNLIRKHAYEQEAVKYLDSDITRMQDDIRSAQQRRMDAVNKYIAENPAVVKSPDVSLEYNRLFKLLN